MEIFKKNTYAFIFTTLVGASFVMWAIILFWKGMDSDQFGIFFLQTDNLFADFLNICGYASERDVYNNVVNGMQEKAYPPITYMLSYIFSRIVNYEETAYTQTYCQTRFLIIFVLALVILIVLLYTLILYYLNGNIAYRLATALLIVSSGIMLFTLERCNIILLAEIFILFYLFNYNNENNIYKELALMSLAIAASIKITPAILGVLLLYKRQFKEAFRSMIYGLCAFFLPFLFFKGGFSNISLMIEHMQMFFETYSDYNGISMKALAYNIKSWINPDYVWPSTWDLSVRIISILLTIVFIIMASVMKKEWEQWLFLVIPMIIFPKISNEYCLIYFIPVLIGFLNDQSRSMEDALILLAFILGWNTYVLFEIPNYQIAMSLLIFAALIKAVKRMGDFITLLI